MAIFTIIVENARETAKMDSFCFVDVRFGLFFFGDMILSRRLKNIRYINPASNSATKIYTNPAKVSRTDRRKKYPTNALQATRGIAMTVLTTKSTLSIL